MAMIDHLVFGLVEEFMPMEETKKDAQNTF
jgi:hypothetical protein